MKEVAPHDRPREKLERLGPSALGDNELLALVLGSGSRGHDVLELSNVVLEQCGGLHGLTRAAAADLRRIAGSRGRPRGPGARGGGAWTPDAGAHARRPAAV